MWILGKETGGIFREKRYLEMDSIDEYTMVRDTQEATIFTSEEEAERVQKLLFWKEALNVIKLS